MKSREHIISTIKEILGDCDKKQKEIGVNNIAPIMIQAYSARILDVLMDIRDILIRNEEVADETNNPEG
jgi:hypothetical protein